jgi:serine/threonine-protein kinase RsbW
MIDARKLRINLESTLDSVEAAELIVQRMAELNGFDEDQVHQIGMGVRETVANAVKHGNRYRTDKTVSFDASIDEVAFRVTVIDQGPGFAPDCVPDPLQSENLLMDSGRGLLLMRAFFDEVDVGPCLGSGTRVRLVKYRTTGAGGTAREEDR